MHRSLNTLESCQRAQASATCHTCRLFFPCSRRRCHQRMALQGRLGRLASSRLGRTELSFLPTRIERQFPLVRCSPLARARTSAEGRCWYRTRSGKLGSLELCSFVHSLARPRPPGCKWSKMDATLLPRSLTSTPFLPSPLSPDFLGAAVVTTSCPVEDDLSPRPPLTSPPTISPSLLYQPSPIPLLPSPQARAPSSQDCAKLLNYPPTARRSSAQPASSWDAAVLAPAVSFPASDHPYLSPLDSEHLA